MSLTEKTPRIGKTANGVLCYAHHESRSKENAHTNINNVDLGK